MKSFFQAIFQTIHKMRHSLLFWMTQLVSGLGSGAVMFFGLLWICGIGVCLLFRNDRAIRELES